MPVRGKYEPRTQTTSIDLGSHLFEDMKGVLYHENTHYYLTKFTNHGSVFSILSEITLNTNGLGANLSAVVAANKALHESCYLVQEGFAHLMQARTIIDTGDKQDVKDWEDLLPTRPKRAFDEVRFALFLDSELFNKFTEKVSRLTMNTDIGSIAAQDTTIILEDDKLTNYLSENSHSPNKRLKLLCEAVERDNQALLLSDEELCARANISYQPPISNKEKAELINSLTSLTTTPAHLTADDITSLSTPEEMFMGAYEGMIIRDANIEHDAIVNFAQDAIAREVPYFRTLYIFNSPEVIVEVGKAGFYSFSKKRTIYNGRVTIEVATMVVANPLLTKVVDSHSYDYTNNRIKPDRAFTNPNIVWYKNYNDLKILLEMVKAKKLAMQINTIAFTEEHAYWFYILKLESHPLYCT